MKKLFILSLGVLFAGQVLYAQRSCGVMHHHEEIVKKHPEAQKNLDEINKFTEQYIKNGGAVNKAVITIPVVVHVVYNTTSQNVSLAQIQSQIDVLNKDFRKLNTDASLIPSTFSGVAADCEINFCLATLDPNGVATTGVIRKSTTTTLFTDDDRVKSDGTGGSTAWNASKYLNLWVCNLGSGLLGYAQFPGGPASTDGVVINYTAFGTSGSAQAPFNKGRTTTHEVGHWLNIYHIGGDTYGGCGSDQVSDTPTQKGGSDAAGTGNDYGQNYGCPTHPLVRSGECSGTTAEMFMNYMDYTDDNCMYMFTTGQKNRMQALFATGGARVGLVTSNGCGGTPPPPSYCTVGATNSTYEWIGNVTLGTINNTSGANGGYGDFTAQSTSLTAGTSYNISLTPAFASSTYSEYFNVYIDYNNDLDFVDAGELVYSSAGTTTAVTGNFTVPAGTAAGAKRMRVIMKDGAITSPCGSYTYGETEDYTVNISSGATCGAPTGLSAGSLTSSSAALSWTAVSGATSYTILYKTSAASTWTSTTSTTNSKSLTGLAASTTYNWTVSATCASGTSTATTGTNFTTSATPPASYCTAGGTNVSYEWINNVTLGTINNTSGANGGYGDFTAQSTSLTAGTAYTISLSPAYASSAYSEYFNVYIDYNNDLDFTDAGELVYSSAGTTTTVTGNFTVPAGTATGAKRMRVIMKDGAITSPCGSYTYGETEDYTVNIVSGSTCNAPTGLAAGSVTSSGASLSWTAVSGATGYTVQYKTSAASTWTSVTTTSASRTLTGLSASTTYNWRVSTTCASGTSAYTTGTNFTTSAAGCSDAYESNNTLSAAKTITVNTNISASIGSTTDVDWLKFTNTTTLKNIRVTLTTLPYDYDLYLYNSAGTLLYSSENGSTTSETITYNNAPVATYYIKVVGYNSAYSTTSCYTLRASTSSTAFKVNPYAEEETVSKTPESVLTVMPNPSVDGKFTFNLTNIHTGTVNVDVYDESGRIVLQQQIQKSEDFMKEGIDLSEKNKGMYIVKIYNDQFHVTERILFVK